MSNESESRTENDASLYEEVMCCVMSEMFIDRDTMNAAVRVRNETDKTAKLSSALNGRVLSRVLVIPTGEQLR